MANNSTPGILQPGQQTYWVLNPQDPNNIVKPKTTLPAHAPTTTEVTVAQAAFDDAKKAYDAAVARLNQFIEQNKVIPGMVSDATIAAQREVVDAARVKRNAALLTLQIAVHRFTAAGGTATTLARLKISTNAKTIPISNAAAAASSATTVLQTGPEIKAYQYNLPIVATMRFSSGTHNPKTADAEDGSPQRQSAGGTDISDGTWRTTGKTMWEGARGKGVIQVSRDIVNASKLSNNTYDNTKYGFRFHYNPSSVSMTWGTSSEVDYSFEASGSDKANPIATGLIQSTISFSLLLNRVEDFKYINANGLKDPSQNPYTPVKVPPGGLRMKEVKEIYKKGTMYDLEYFFKTVMAPHATFNATVMGTTTADRGWINQAPVELHLGDGLRYKVRITDLSVNHAMFNDRMVPILSTVNITCTRYYDGMASDWSNGSAS